MKQINLVLRMVMGGLWMLPLMGWSQATRCPNLDFSTGTLQHWQFYVGSCGGGAYQVQKSPAVPGRHTIMSLEALLATNQLYDESCDKIEKVPKGYSFSCRIGNSATGAEVDAIEYEMTVDSMNSLLILAFAWVMEDPQHNLGEQPQFTMKITDSAGSVLDIPCGNVNFVSAQDLPVLACETGDLVARNWTTVGFSLESVIGQKIKIYFETRDCTLGGHYGYAYVVGECRPMRIDVAYCTGNNIARLRAPDGFESYTWTRSDLPGWTDYRQQITIQDPTDSAIVTCVLKSELGCESELSTMIVMTFIDADFQFGVKNEYGEVDFVSHGNQNWYDTCSRTATFVEFAEVQNSVKSSLLWEIHGLNVTGRDSMFTYTFPDTDEPKEYLVRLTVTAENGCMDTSQSEGHFITIFPSPKIMIDGTTELCQGKEAWLKPVALRSEFTEHYWSWVKSADGSTGTFTGDSLFIGGPGTYSLKSLDVNAVDCYAYDTLVVTTLKPVINNIEIRTVDCYGNATGMFRHGPITGGKEPFQVAQWRIWDNENKVFKDSSIISRVSSGATFWNQIAGVYTFYGIDAKDCEVHDTVIIQEPDSLRFSVTPKPTTCFEDNGAIAFEFVGGTSPYSISISGTVNVNGTPKDAAADTIRNLPAGVYVAMVLDKNNCVSSSSDTITIITALVQEIPLLSISLMEREIAITENQDTTLCVIFNPIDACNQDVVWHSQDENIATVDADGIVTGGFLGETYIVVTSDEGGFQDSCKIIVLGVGINSWVKKDKDLFVYPNPASTQLHVKRSSQETADYSMYNVIGQIILEGKLQDSSTINIESLAKGMYYLRVLDKVVKFVKE